MKVIRFDWEQELLIKSLSCSLFGYENLAHSHHLPPVTSLFVSANPSRQAEFPSSLSFMSRVVGSRHLPIVRKPEQQHSNRALGRTQHNTVLLSCEVNSLALLEGILYVNIFFLKKIYDDKQIRFSNSLAQGRYSNSLRELNSSLKLGHSLNIIDHDPLLRLQFDLRSSGRVLLQHVLNKL